MPRPEFERFRRLVDSSHTLQAELWAITDLTEFVAAVVRRAADHDCMVVEGEVWEAISAGRSAWQRAQMP